MGIDIHRIAKIESIPWEHLCPACQLLINPNEALQSVCGHLFCKSCLTYVASTTGMCPYDGYMVTEIYAKPLVESNKVLADTIGKTLVYCSYQNSGCPWVGSLADSSFHCYACVFGNSLIMSSSCGIDFQRRQRLEHIQGAYPQASIATATTQASDVMATSQPSAQAHAVASSVMIQNQWYQQPYQQYNQNYVGGYMQQQPYQQYNQNYIGGYMQQQLMQRQSFAPHNQVIYVQARPLVHYVADQTHSQMQPQLQVQSQSLAMHQPHDAFPSPHDNTVHDSLAQNAIGQCPSNQPHSSWTIVHNPQSNQTNQVGVPENNIIVHDQDHFPEHVSQPLLPSQLTRDQSTREMVVKYRGALAPEISDMHSSQQPFSNRPLSQPHRAANAIIHNQMNHEGSSYPSHIALQENHQDMSPILGLQPDLNYFSATGAHVGMPFVKEDDMQRIPKQVHWVSSGKEKILHIYGNKDDEAVMEATDSSNTPYGVNRVVEVTTTKFDQKLKGKLDDGSAESVHRSNIVVEGMEIKCGPLDKLVVEKDVENGWVDLGNSILVEKSGIDDDPSLDGTPLMNPTLSDQDGYISPISEHLGVASHGNGPSGGKSDLHRSEIKGIGNLQTEEKVIPADMIGPVDSNGLRLGDVGSQSRYTLQGYPGDHGGSFQGDWMTITDVESLDFHSQTKEHQQNEKKRKMAPSDSSQFGNQNKNEESRFKGSG